MDEVRNDGQPSAKGVPGLKCVICGLKRFVGKIDRKATEAIKKNMGKDFVVLKDAYELNVKYRETPQGTQVQMVPVPIAPFGSKTTIEVRVDVMLDVSKEPAMKDMEDVINSMVATDHGQLERHSPSGLVLPNGPLDPAAQRALERKLRQG